MHIHIPLQASAPARLFLLDLLMGRDAPTLRTGDRHQTADGQVRAVVKIIEAGGDMAELRVLDRVDQDGEAVELGYSVSVCGLIEQAREYARMGLAARKRPEPSSPSVDRAAGFC